MIPCEKSHGFLRLEFKRSTGELKEVMNSICAILNKHQCGELYFGVKADGTVIGQIITEETLREVSQKINNSIEPRTYFSTWPGRQPMGKSGFK